MSGLERRLAEVAAAVEAELERVLPPARGEAAVLAEAMRWSALGGGKRLRPLLVVASGELAGAAPAACIRVGTAIELLHTFSLIHDDLPAMDDALLRRGRPACHRQFDEATAILAGDALQALAFELLAADDYGVDAGRRVELVAGLARAAGAAGMCGGQMLDLLGERRPLPLPVIEQMQRMKTGAILAFSVDAGWILGRLDQEARTVLAAFARDLGQAFQVKDDLLDIEGDAAATGKDHGRDAAAGKPTLLAALGLDAARARLAELHGHARAQLDIFGTEGTLLREILDLVVHRRS